MRGYFAIEALLVLFLLPYLIYLLTPEPFVLPRETAELANDFAQIYSYGFNTSFKGFIVWIDGLQYGNCSYIFRYCTKRFIGKEVEICLAECSQY